MKILLLASNSYSRRDEIIIVSFIFIYCDVSQKKNPEHYFFFATRPPVKSANALGEHRLIKEPKNTK